MHLRMCTRTASFAVSLCRACYVHLLALDRVLGPRGLKMAEDGPKMATRWPQDGPKMGHKAVLEVAFAR